MSSVESSIGSSSSSSSSSSVVYPAGELAINGGFEESPLGTAAANWVLGSGMRIVEGEHVLTGNRALEVVVTTLGSNPWDIQLVYSGADGAGVPVLSGTEYLYSIWIKGPAGARVNFTVGRPDYQELERREETLTGAWQQVVLEITTSADDTVLRMPTHFSISGNAGATFHLDDFSFRLKNPPATGYSPVTVAHLYALSPNNMPIGVAVPAGDASISLLNSPARQAVVNQHFSQITAENIMKPSYLQPAQGTFFWTHADALVNYAEANGLTVHGHTLLWHTQIPNWMQNFSGTREQWLDMMRTHIAAVAGRYAGRNSVVSWDVVNEAFEDAGSRYRGDPLADSNSRVSVWYENIGPEYIEEAFKAARAAAPNADLYYNDFSIEWNQPKLNAVIALVEDFLARDVPIDGVGFQMHVWANANVNNIRNHLKAVADTGVKVKITELDVRFNHVSPPLAANAYTPALADQHKQLIRDIVKAYLDVVPPAQRGGITVWGVADGDSWLLSLYGRPDWPLFFFNDMSPKPALQGFADALSGS